MKTCPIEQSLNAHLSDLDNQREIEDAIEFKTVEIREKLLSVSTKFELAFVEDAEGNKIELSDFIGDMEINDGLFSEFLSGGDLLKDKLNKQLDEYCELIATGLVNKQERNL